MFKVGYVWISYTDTSPSGLVGGTWTPITGVFPYFNAGTGTGGSNTHTLNVSEMPSHNHYPLHGNVETSVVTTGGGAAGARIPLNGASYATDTLRDTGGSLPHNNMPAYQTLYAWRRTE